MLNTQMVNKNTVIIAVCVVAAVVAGVVLGSLYLPAIVNPPQVASNPKVQKVNVEVPSVAIGDRDVDHDTTEPGLHILDEAQRMHLPKNFVENFAAQEAFAAEEGFTAEAEEALREVEERKDSANDNHFDMMLTATHAIRMGSHIDGKVEPLKSLVKYNSVF